VVRLVLLGAVIRSVTSEDSVSVNASDRSATAGTSANDQEPTEPLAELGVAPGSTDSENGTGSTSGGTK
jgi:hypothetical protein